MKPEDALLSTCIHSGHLALPVPQDWDVEWPLGSRDVARSNSMATLYGELWYWVVARRKRVCALQGTEMSLLFGERRFREDGKISAICCSQISISLLCPRNVMLRAGFCRLVSCCIGSKTNSFSNQIPWTWQQMSGWLGGPWCLRCGGPSKLGRCHTDPCSGIWNLPLGSHAVFGFLSRPYPQPCPTDTHHFSVLACLEATVTHRFLGPEEQAWQSATLQAPPCHTAPWAR